MEEFKGTWSPTQAWLGKERRRAVFQWQSPISKDLENWESGWGCWEEPWLRVINMPSKGRETQTSRGSRVPGFHSQLGKHSCSTRAALGNMHVYSLSAGDNSMDSGVPGVGDLAYLLHSPLCLASGLGFPWSMLPWGTGLETLWTICPEAPLECVVTWRYDCASRAIHGGAP